MPSCVVGQLWWEGFHSRIWPNLVELYLFQQLHFPILVFMFVKNIGAPSPMTWSFAMDWARLREGILGNHDMYATMSLYPAFVGTYARIQDIAWFLGVCEAMRNLGQCLFHLGWANILLCGDPPNC